MNETPSDRLQEVADLLSEPERMRLFAETAALLTEHGRLHPSNGIPAFYYHAGAPAFPQFAAELIVFESLDTEDPKIFLIQRPNDDPEWPGEWHFPGTTLRSGDDADSMGERLLAELDDDVEISQPTTAFFHITSLADRVRGACAHQVFVAEHLSGSPKNGEFVSIRSILSDAPDRRVMQHHIGMIAIVVEMFNQRGEQP